MSQVKARAVVDVSYPGTSKDIPVHHVKNINRLLSIPEIDEEISWVKVSPLTEFEYSFEFQIDLDLFADSWASAGDAARDAVALALGDGIIGFGIDGIQLTPR